MKSIRLSLMVYFLVLLAVALGAVSVLAYRNTESVLQSKEATRQQMLTTQYDVDCKREQTKIKDALGFQAFGFFRVVAQSYWGHLRAKMLAPLGLLGVSLDPNGYLAAPIWLGARTPGPWSEYLFNKFLTDFQYEDPMLDHPSENRPPEYFQIASEGGSSWKSRSLGDRSFPVDMAAFQKIEFNKWQTDEFDLERGVHVLRMTRKVYPERMMFRGPRPPRPDRMPGPTRDVSRRSGPPPLEAPERFSHAILLYCAIETNQRDAKLAQLKADLDGNLANLKAESRTTLANLRNRLLLINLATFATVMVGGFWLVRLGLSSLRRLSDAVSLVSPRDFRLPFDEPRLPGELQPIVERLTQTLELLKRAFAREKQAAADISHELRTPLAALLTTIEVALRKPRDPQEYRDVLSDCHATGQQMNQLVERLLALARIDAGVDTMRPRSVDVTNLADQCANLVRPLAEARGLNLHVHRNSPIQLHTDPDKLREVINNLLHNAIEYNYPNGSVDLCVERRNGHLQVEVRDTGIGIASEAREHIFERFYRADPSRHAEGLHAGLGLAIVKGYVDLMGGTIAVESTPGKGSTFRLELPLQPQPRPAP